MDGLIILNVAAFRGSSQRSAGREVVLSHFATPKCSALEAMQRSVQIKMSVLSKLNRYHSSLARTEVRKTYEEPYPKLTVRSAPSA